MNDLRRILFDASGLFAGLRECLDNRLIGSTLVLAYSLIDTLAWLGLPADQDEVKRSDFIEWTERYLIPLGTLECSATDLYAARCGVVHTMTPDSRLSREGKAIRIAYSWGNQAPYPRAKLKQVGVEWVMIHVDTMCSAIEHAARAFLQEVEVDPVRLKILDGRAGKLLRNNGELPPHLP